MLRIKGMQGLTGFMQYKIGDINDVIDWPHANGSQFVLQPGRAFFYGNAADANARCSAGRHAGISMLTVMGRLLLSGLNELL